MRCIFQKLTGITFINKVKSYKVACYETVHAYIYIDATSEDEALELAQEILLTDGMPSDAKVFDREFEACIAELSN